MTAAVVRRLTVVAGVASLCVAGLAAAQVASAHVLAVSSLGNKCVVGTWRDDGGIPRRIGTVTSSR